MKMLYTLMFFAALFFLFTLAAILGVGLNFCLRDSRLGMDICNVFPFRLGGIPGF
jgi:hypothetical protein